MSERPPAVALTRLHRILIGSAIALSIGFGVYQIAEFRRGVEGAVVWIAASAAMAVLLSSYLVWFNKKSRRS